MKVVVTGASGYIGRHVVDALIKMHHEVIAVDMINKGINTDECVAIGAAILRYFLR